MLEAVPSDRSNELHGFNKTELGSHHLLLPGEKSGLVRSSQYSPAASLDSDLQLVQSSKVEKLHLLDQTDDLLKLSKSLPLSSDKHHQSSSLGSETVGDIAASGVDPLLNGGKSHKKRSNGNTLDTARRIKLTEQWHTIEDSVGSSDRFDFYRFKLNTSSSFHLRLVGEQNTVDVTLINASGQTVEDLSGPFGKKRVALHTALDAGTYYLKVTGHDSDTPYQLSLSDDPGGARQSAQPVSANQQAIVNTVGSTDRSDMYRFVVNRKSTVQCNLEGLKANADLTLMNSQGRILQTSRHFGKKDESIAATLEQGTYYVKVTGWGRKTKYRLNLSAQEEPVLPIPKPSAPGTGIFTVGETGKVSIDYLFDGSPLQGELAIFNLKGMEQYGIGSKRYMQEAMLRALGNSPDSGYVAILDQTEGARFSSSPGEPNFNAGEYRGTKTFTMNPGDKFGIMLVPNGTTPDALFNSDLSGEQRPLFSMPEANPESAIQLAQVVDVVADGNSFAFEDTSLTNDSDRDYNDLIFQVQGAVGQTSLLNDVIVPSKEWRNSEIGQEVINYATTNENGPLSNVGNDLATVYLEYQNYIQNGGNPSAFDPDNFLLQVQNGQIIIDAIASEDVNTLRTELEALGLQDDAVFGSVVSGLLPIDTINKMATLSSLRFARPAYLPVLDEGNADSQGDARMQADVARNNFGVNGTGVTMGVLSDSYDTFSGASTRAVDDVTSNDLPGFTNTNGFLTPVRVLKDSSINPIDEGRAMLQLIHDVAPGAALAFHTANGGEASFAQGITALADAGANVVVDDMEYWTEPFFQDGIIAQAVDQVVGRGVTYFASAGNYGLQSYESDFTPSGLKIDDHEAHDFDPGPGVDTFQSITIPKGEKFTLSLQWDSPFFSANPASGGSDRDFDIYLLNADGKVIKRQANRNLGKDAVEVLSWENTTNSNQFNLAITSRGLPSGHLKYIFKSKPNGSVTINEYNSNPSPTVFGHAAATGAIAVGAADYNQISTPGQVEDFSSRGPTTIWFDQYGNRYATPQIRQKPEVVAPDGVDTTFFGQLDPDPDPTKRLYENNGLPNFSGTSAAAPHAAAVAALLLDNRPGTPPDVIRRALQESALDMDNPDTPAFDTGIDNATGAGLIQANNAITALQRIQGSQFDVDIQFPNITVQPPLTRGDEEFNGHGPQIQIQTQAVIQGKTLRLIGSASFAETQKDWTTFNQSFFSNLIDIAANYPGFMIDSVLSNQSDSLYTVDVDQHDNQQFVLGDNNLVARYDIQGDTYQFIGGDQPDVSLAFNPVRVRLKSPSGKLIEDSFNIPNIEKDKRRFVSSTQGDNDFDGNGPEITISTQVVADNTILRPRVNAVFKETQDDYTTFASNFDGDGVDVSERYPGYVIDAILSDQSDRLQTVDVEQHADQGISLGSSHLVANYVLQGDIDGDDHPSATISFNPIRVRLRPV